MVHPGGVCSCVVLSFFFDGERRGEGVVGNGVGKRGDAKRQGEGTGIERGEEQENH